MTTTNYKGHRITTRSVRRDRLPAIQVKINGVVVWTYQTKTLDEVLTITRGDIDASIDRPFAYTWSRQP